MTKNIACQICRNTKLDVVYEGKIRDGSYGNSSLSDYKVFQCSKCSVQFLNQFVPPELYESEEYRKNYCDSKQLEDYWKAHDDLWNHKLHRIGIHNCRNKTKQTKSKWKIQ